MRISWKTVNGTRSGVVTEERVLYVVRMDDGKRMVVDRRSVLSVEEDRKDEA